MNTINKFGGSPPKLFYIVAFLALSTIALYFIYFDKYPKVIGKEMGIKYSKIYSSTRPDDKTNGLKPHILPLEIYAKDNLTDYQQLFFIPNDTAIAINAVGEAADYSTNPSLFRPWDNDGIEFFFNINNKKIDAFDLNKGDRQYRILWKTLQIDGQNINKSNIKIVEHDPSSTYYIIETTIPWKSLGYQNPQVNARLGFDATIIDSDGGAEKAKIDWHNKIDEDWKNSLNYGTMILSNSPRMEFNPNFVIAVKRKMVLNDTRSLFSNLTPLYSYNNITVGYVKDSLDLSGKFRAEWDEKNLYLQVCVRDNIKSVAKALFDYGWIEDNSGNIVWTMNLADMKYAGGALKNKREDTTLTLKKGLYYLKYHTDESHSSNKWDDAPPKTPFYGIKIDYERGKKQRMAKEITKVR